MSNFSPTAEVLATADIPSTAWWELVGRFWSDRDPSPDYWGSMIIKDPGIDRNGSIG